MTLRSNKRTDISATEVFRKVRRGLFWGGVFLIILGITALAMPLVSTLVVEILIGWLLTISGGASIIGAFSLRGTGLFLWKLIAGFLILAVGLMLLLFPIGSLIAMTALVALVFLLSGAVQTMIALWMRPVSGWGWAFMSALVSLTLGVVIFAVLPQASAVVLGIFVGIDLLSTGVALLLIQQSIREDL